MKTPIGLLGLSRLARDVWIRRAIVSRACRWPMIRSLSVSASLSTASISFLTMRPTGMPVQPATTAATAWPSTVGKIERRIALESRRIRLQFAKLAKRGPDVLRSGLPSYCRVRAAMGAMRRLAAAAGVLGRSAAGDVAAAATGALSVGLSGVQRAALRPRSRAADVQDPCSPAPSRLFQRSSRVLRRAAGLGVPFGGRRLRLGDLDADGFLVGNDAQFRVPGPRSRDGHRRVRPAWRAGRSRCGRPPCREGPPTLSGNCRSGM